MSKAEMFPSMFQLQFSNNTRILRKANNLPLIITADWYLKGLGEFCSNRDAERKRRKKKPTYRSSQTLLQITSAV